MTPRHLALLVAFAGASVGLAGCFTGERPTLAEASVAGSSVGDPAADVVLERLAASDVATFTATYEITNNFGQVTRDATVVQAADRRRSVTIGDIRFVIEGMDTATCDLTVGGPCSATIDDAAVSDLQVTHQFYARSAADRLRTDAQRKVGDIEAYQAEFAGQTADCVSVPVSGGSKVYCAIDGLLASYQGPDVVITLTGFDPTPDESFFARSR